MPLPSVLGTKSPIIASTDCDLSFGVRGVELFRMTPAKTETLLSPPPLKVTPSHHLHG